VTDGQTDGQTEKSKVQYLQHEMHKLVIGEEGWFPVFFDLVHLSLIGRLCKRKLVKINRLTVSKK